MWMGTKNIHICIKKYSQHSSIRSLGPEESLWLSPVKSNPLPLAEPEVLAAQLLELYYKSLWYIELSASLALGPVCIGCSPSLQLSAWRGTVNDGFVLCSPFVLSWFLVQHKQAWNLFYPPQRNGGIQIYRPTIQLFVAGRVNLIFVLELDFVFQKALFVTERRDIHL